MQDLILFLFLLSFIFLVLGLINPKIISFFLKKNLSRKKVGLFFGFATFILFIFFGIVSDSDKQLKRIEKKSISENENKKIIIQNNSKQEKIITPNIKKINEIKENLKYKIIYVLNNKRYDGGKIYYVLIEPINLNSDNFKTEIKTITKKIISERGKKISIEFHDNLESLNISYNYYGIGSLNRQKTNDENKILERHFIAMYDGELETNIYFNTLTFFPAAFKETLEVGKYVETLEFNTSK